MIDLCSGGGGAMEYIAGELHQQMGATVTLTDLYPNTHAFEQLKYESNGAIDYVPASVNALNVPDKLKGVRTIFAGFHHFKPQQAQAILQSAADAGQPIVIIDGGGNRLVNILMTWLIQPFMLLLAPFFIWPWKWYRFVFTLIPIIPFCTAWDGTVSMLRMYNKKQMQQLINDVSTDNYQFEIGHYKATGGAIMNYVVGKPM